MYIVTFYNARFKRFQIISMPVTFCLFWNTVFNCLFYILFIFIFTESVDCRLCAKKLIPDEETSEVH